MHRVPRERKNESSRNAIDVHRADHRVNHSICAHGQVTCWLVLGKRVHDTQRVQLAHTFVRAFRCSFGRDIFPG